LAEVLEGGLKRTSVIQSRAESDLET
jgi:hypothetical protein